MNSSDSSEPDLEVGNRGSFGRIGHKNALQSNET